MKRLPWPGHDVGGRQFTSPLDRSRPGCQVGLGNVALQFATLSTGLMGWPAISLDPALIGLWFGSNAVQERLGAVVLDGGWPCEGRTGV
ncbi:MAG: hypothetical protein MUE60_12160 [Candidatus Eisenbacteria bacterium]|nr:hypothetical protein [Candidatus Eisenbacteria bacterium]